MMHLRYVMKFNTSMAVWVGMIALLGIAMTVSIPAFYVIWRGYELRRAPADGAPPDTASQPAIEGPIPADAP